MRDADQQRDPELKELLQKIMGSNTGCFTDKYESVVWYKAMEPRLAQFVPTHEERLEILDHVYCEAKRDPTTQIPPDLVLALMEVESRFDRWAVSPAGAKSARALRAATGQCCWALKTRELSLTAYAPALLKCRQFPSCVVRVSVT